jgi:hypothetical protein
MSATVTRHDAVGLDCRPLRPARVGVHARGDVHRDDRRARGVQLLGRGRRRLAERARHARPEHPVDDDVAVGQIERAGVRYLLGIDFGAPERRPVLAGDVGADGVGTPEQVDRHVVLVEEARGDEGVAAVVAPPGDDDDARAGVGHFAHLARDGVPARLHQLFARNPERRGVLVDSGHPVAG